MSSKAQTTATNEAAKPALVPELRFPEFRGAEEWKLKKLSSSVQLVSGMHLSPEQYSTEGEVPYFTGPSDFTNSVEAITKRTSDSANLAKKDDTLITVKGSGVGEIWYLTLPSVAMGRQLMAVRARDASSRFIFQFLLTKRGRFEDLAAGNLIPGLARGDILDLEAPFPLLREQQKISDCLSSMDELIAAQARKVDALKTHKKGLMQQLFPREGETQPRLRFPEFQNAGEWEEKSLGEIVEVASGQVDPTEPPYCDFPQIGSENIESNTGKMVNVRSAGDKGIISGNYAFDENDVLYSKIRPALNKVAAPAFKGICSADVYPIRPANDGLLRSYLLYLLLSKKFLEYAIRNSERGKIPKINRDGLLSYMAMIPSPAEQQRIASCLSSLDALITAETQKLEALKTHKKGLMQQLFPSSEESL